MLAGPWTVVTAPCDGTDKQRWKLEAYNQGGTDAKYPLRMHNAAENFCIYTDLTGLVYGRRSTATWLEQSQSPGRRPTIWAARSRKAPFVP